MPRLPRSWSSSVRPSPKENFCPNLPRTSPHAADVCRRVNGGPHPSSRWYARPRRKAPVFPKHFMRVTKLGDQSLIAMQELRPWANGSERNSLCLIRRRFCRPRHGRMRISGGCRQMRRRLSMRFWQPSRRSSPRFCLQLADVMLRSSQERVGPNKSLRTLLWCRQTCQCPSRCRPSQARADAAIGLTMVPTLSLVELALRQSRLVHRQRQPVGALERPTPCLCKQRLCWYRLSQCH
mmetsp:Transcript_90478/g.230112  ORF Transcript_90478/g.230112 Transcript_90478/m.230112 type:complete len:237 (+) Transcript_90478:158-868(+)